MTRMPRERTCGLAVAFVLIWCDYAAAEVDTRFRFSHLSIFDQGDPEDSDDNKQLLRTDDNLSAAQVNLQGSLGGHTASQQMTIDIDNGRSSVSLSSDLTGIPIAERILNGLFSSSSSRISRTRATTRTNAQQTSGPVWSAWKSHVEAFLCLLQLAVLGRLLWRPAGVVAELGSSWLLSFSVAFSDVQQHRQTGSIQRLAHLNGLA